MLSIALELLFVKTNKELPKKSLLVNPSKHEQDNPISTELILARLK